MNKPQILIAHHDQKMILDGALSIFIFLCMCIVFVVFLPKLEFSFFTLERSIKTIFLLVIKSFLWFSISFFSIGLISMIFMIKYYLLQSKIPDLIIDKAGIRIKVFNFIPWDNIEDVFPVYGPSTLSCIAIKLKNKKLAYKEADILGKVGIFNNSLVTKKYNITVSNLDISDEEIFRFIDNLKK